MITKTKQNWTVGQTVKVGFLALTVKAVSGSEYILANKSGTKLYAFLPYEGCRAISIDEARDLMAKAKYAAARLAEGAIAQIKKSSADAREIESLFA